MKDLKVITIPHPLAVHDGRRIVSVPFSGQDLTDILNEHAAEMDSVIVRINGVKIPPVAKDQYRQTLRAGDEIIILPAVSDPVTAVTAVTSWLAGPLGMLAPELLDVSRDALSIGLGFGAPYLLRLIGPAPDDADVDSVPSYQWSPVTTQRQGIVIPRAYGTNKQTGNIIAAWRTPDGADETLSMLLSFGEGPESGIVADTIYLNGQPIDNYESVTTYERKGLMEQSAVFSTLKCEYAPELEILHTDDGGGPVTWTTPDNDFDWLEIAVRYSGHYVQKDGGSKTQTVSVKIEISEHGAESWYTLADESLSCSSTPLQKNYLSTGTYTGGSPVSITKGTRCDIRVTKTVAGRVWDDNRKSRYLYLTTIREVINTAFKYPGLSLLGISAVATEDLSGSLQVSCIRKGRIINTYNGSSWTLQWSDNPAWVLWDILTRPVISGDGGGTPYAIERYDGIDPARLTPYLDEWFAAAEHFEDAVLDGKGGYEERIQFNGVFDSPTTVWEAMAKVCGVARCEVLRIGRNYTILVDKPDSSAPVQLFSAGNIKPGSYRRNYIDLNDRAGELEIDYQDQDLDYEMTPMLHVDSGIDSHAVKTIDGFGVTRASQAWRSLYYELAKNRILKYVIEFEADIDAIACKKGDIVYVVEPWRLGGRIVNCPASNQVTLDAPPKVSGADTIAVRVNHPDTGAETVEPHAVASVSGSVVTISDTWTVTPKKDDLYAFGPTAAILKKFRVVGITEEGEL